jgi:hypothetical protein
MPKIETIESSSMYDISQYNLMNIKSMNKQICNPVIQSDIPSKQKQITGNLHQYDVVEHFKRGIICDDSKK